MKKTIVYKYKDGSCGIAAPAFEMFNPNSRDRWDFRAKGIDFCDVKIIDFLERIIPLKNEIINLQNKLKEVADLENEDELKQVCKISIAQTFNKLIIERDKIIEEQKLYKDIILSSVNYVFINKVVLPTKLLIIDLERTEEAEIEILNFIAQEAIFKLKLEQKENFISYRIIDKESLPNDEEFRNAWTDDFETETIDVHNEKAREVKLKNIRHHRKSKFEEINQELLICLLSQINKNSSPELQTIKSKWEGVKNITEPLKTLEIKKQNCLETLNKIKELGTI